MKTENKKNISPKKDFKILVSMGTCGIAAGAKDILDTIKKYLEKSKTIAKYEVIETGCMGLCHSEPTIEIVNNTDNSSIIYGKLKPAHINLLFSANNTAQEQLTIIDKNWYYPEDEENTRNFLQSRIVLRNCGRINPEKIEHYTENKGYQALKKVLSEMSPEDVIHEIKRSGLRGRGGGGFSTGRKWSFAAASNSKDKFMICNADEGDPGAFMDRAILEGDPHAVIEAMTIGGYAIGANKGIFYVRAEYPLAIKRLNIAILQAEKNNFLGDNILGSDFSFSLEIKYGAGAFVCGEETALIHSIEGLRGTPSFRPPYPAVSGLWDKPTVVNNVETYANICPIIRKGAEWFKHIGTEHSPGTKVFALAGKVNKVGLIEVPIGISMKDIVFKIGEGIQDNKKLKAVQAGGPSGGCITADHIDVPIDYDTLKSLGSMMGSGGIIVMDESSCMVDIAKFFLEFTVEESCGKCTPCRIGGKHMLMILQKITEGKGTKDDLKQLHHLAKVIRTTSLCGLGMTSPNPVLSTLRHFKEEYNEHVLERKCQAKKCTALLNYSISAKRCIGCTKCARVCPVNCISGKIKEAHIINNDECIKCGQCMQACKFNAIIIK